MMKRSYLVPGPDLLELIDALAIVLLPASSLLPAPAPAAFSAAMQRCQHIRLFTTLATVRHVVCSPFFRCSVQAMPQRMLSAACAALLRQQLQGYPIQGAIVLQSC